MSDPRLHPAENMALTVARGQASRGADITPNIAAFLVLTLDRLLSDPDAEDPRIAAAWGLVQAWDRQARRALENKAALEHRPWTESRHAALHVEVCAAVDHAAALRLVLRARATDGDTPGGAS